MKVSTLLFTCYLILLVVCQACSTCCTADTGWPNYYCTNYEYPPNKVSGLLVTSVDPIMKEIGTA